MKTTNRKKKCKRIEKERDELEMDNSQARQAEEIIRDAIQIEWYIIRYAKAIIEALMVQWQSWINETALEIKMKFLLIDVDWFLMYPHHDFTMFFSHLHQLLANETKKSKIRSLINKHPVLQRMKSVVPIFDILFASVMRLKLLFDLVEPRDPADLLFVPKKIPSTLSIRRFEMMVKDKKTVPNTSIPLPYGAFNSNMEMMSMTVQIWTWYHAESENYVGNFFDMLKETIGLYGQWSVGS